MKLTYRGEGTVHIPGAGDVHAGGTIEVPDATAAALVQQDPRTWGTPKKASPASKDGTGRG
jgi:hypothetical protein